MREADWQQRVIDLAHLYGWLTYHTHDSRRSTHGFPDLVMIRGERMIVAELKVGRNKPTPAQTRWLEAFANTGTAAYLWYPEDWDEVREVLKHDVAT